MKKLDGHITKHLDNKLITKKTITTTAQQKTIIEPSASINIQSPAGCSLAQTIYLRNGRRLERLEASWRITFVHIHEAVTTPGYWRSYLLAISWVFSWGCTADKLKQWKNAVQKSWELKTWVQVVGCCGRTMLFHLSTHSVAQCRLAFVNIHNILAMRSLEARQRWITASLVLCHNGPNQVVSISSCAIHRFSACATEQFYIISTVHWLLLQPSDTNIYTHVKHITSVTRLTCG